MVHLLFYFYLTASEEVTRDARVLSKFKRIFMARLSHISMTLRPRELAMQSRSIRPDHPSSIEADRILRCEMGRAD